MNKKLLIAVIVLAGLLLLTVGYLLGTANSNNNAPAPAPTPLVSDMLAPEQADTMAVVAEEPVNEVVEEKVPETKKTTKSSTSTTVTKTATKADDSKNPEVKTYGYYPSFYVKKAYYTVGYDSGSHNIQIFTDGSTRLKKAWTNCHWLNEDDLERGGSSFKFRKNRDEESRKGELYLVDDKGRKITIYVTQQGQP